MKFQYIAWTRYPRSADARVVLGDNIRVAFNRDGSIKTATHDVAGSERLLWAAIDRDNAAQLSVADFEARYGKRAQA